MFAKPQLLSALGPIEPDVVYPLPDLKARSGMGNTALRTARKSGLKVMYAGGRAYCKGSDFIEWLEQNSQATKR
jgi:hypothetical protein